MQTVTTNFSCETPEAIVKAKNFERLAYALAVSSNIGLAILFAIVGWFLRLLITSQSFWSSCIFVARITCPWFLYLHGWVDS